ncbi:hypothetical protein DKT77_09770 [Meridianimarinicoccus roseus]|uniref:Uncharacterized protein n=1 Tax=Meridianimarinicoccus roseus TaxID=2072018 RepID=A0A2V2LM90_9RHOB|nr:hypothetical protein DKT77_09770 [Meridianimarinicoccus roseus]
MAKALETRVAPKLAAYQPRLSLFPTTRPVTVCEMASLNGGKVAVMPGSSLGRTQVPLLSEAAEEGTTHLTRRHFRQVRKCPVCVRRRPSRSEK